MPVSRIAREAIEAELGLDGNEQRAWPFIGLWESDGSVSAADLDDWLAEHWADDIENDAFAGSR